MQIQSRKLMVQAIPYLFLLEFLVCDLPQHKPNMLGILMGLLVWLTVIPSLLLARTV